MSLVKEIDCGTGKSAVEIGQDAHEALQTFKVVHLVNVPAQEEDLRSFYEDVTAQIGPLVGIDEDSITGEMTNQTWISIYYDKNMQDRYRHAKTGQPLHTDTAYISDPGDISLLYCVNQAPEGGETIFISSEDLIDLIKQKNPALFEELCRVDVSFSKSKDGKKRPVIEYQEGSPILTWNYIRVSPEQSEEALDLAERFHHFLETEVVPSSKMTGIALKPKEAAIWRDEELLHGRRSYQAIENKDRLLWKVHMKMRKK